MIVRVSTEGQVLIPQPIREKYGLRLGVGIGVVERGVEIDVRKKPCRNEALLEHLLKLRGSGLQIAKRRKEHSRPVDL